MKTTHDISQLDWTLTGWIPYLWRLGQPVEVNTSQTAEVPAVPVKVPGSIQMALLEAGVIPDWNNGMNYRACQWAENLHWVYQAIIPDEWVTPGASFRMDCQGLDGSGWVLLNMSDVAEFSGSHIPHSFDLTEHLKPSGNILHIVFDCPPRWLGQFGYTSKMTEWKVRFNYTWDWTARLVQIGIWDSLTMTSSDGVEISEFRAVADVEDGQRGAYLRGWGAVSGADACKVRLSLEKDGAVLRSDEASASDFNNGGITLAGLDVERWWPNMQGNQPLYQAKLTLLGRDGEVIEEQIKPVGFRSIKWDACESAPSEADPWILNCNGRQIFLQGANWVPIRSNFADVTEAQYRQWITLYKDLGFNILRVWGGAVLERECFYDVCDELGILVWQEYPLSSSGVDDCPPVDEKFISEMVPVAESYIKRRQHHVSLIIWCGGNELITKEGGYRPVDDQHPMIKMLKEVTEREDPSRRFLVTSPSGPKVHGNKSDYGKGVHWDVHGPWVAGSFGMADKSLAEWDAYWEGDDSLFRSETGCSGSSSLDILEKYRGDCSVTPATLDNPYWRRNLPWWIDYDEVTKENGREPSGMEEYVQFSQERQRHALEVAVRTCKDRFPKCGGVILWMGHDCYPCAANTSVIDFECHPKPAALAIGDIFRK